MKIIGKPVLEKDKDGEYVDTAYINGTIIMLTEREAKTLGLLQNALKGEVFKWDAYQYDLRDKDMNNAFMAIRCFVEAKFSVNELEAMVNNLNEVLIKEK